MQPIKTSSISEARTLAERDGAVILDQVGASADDAKSVMQALLGSGLRALPEPARVFDGGEQDRKQAGNTFQDPLKVHTDGFAYGDLYPDCLLLVCVHSSAQGGESYLVDGYDILETLATQQDTAWIARALMETAVDQTEEGMQSALSPIVQTTPNGRVMVRRILDEYGNGPKAAPDSSNPERDTQMIDTWTNTIEAAASKAPRFRLEPGQALLVDNYRMFHGREGYADPTRMMWRVWGWSDQALGVPDMPLHSDTRYAHSDSG